MIYRGYSIEVAETEYDRWQAVIKRVDGRMIADGGRLGVSHLHAEFDLG
jgi:hypothetical protein